MTSPARLILASTSPYRRALLERLRLPFDVVAPDVDERSRAGEAPAELARRLAIAKADAVAENHPEAWVIGSDQVAEVDDNVVGKPGTHAAAADQLERASGKTLTFFTAVCLSGPGGDPQFTHTDRTEVAFRRLSRETIESYLSIEKPYDCAGAFKSEALGITLCERIDTSDPTALIGLPLIRLADLLRQAGFSPV